MLFLSDKPSRFDPNRGSLRTFLLTQTHSISIDLIRSEKARSNREEKQGKISMHSTSLKMLSVEDEVANMQLTETMSDAISNLSVGEREAIVLSYYKGHTYREVAQILSQPEGTIKSRIRSAMSKLKTHLQDSISEGV